MQLACLCLDLYPVKSEKENGSNSPFIHSCGAALVSMVSLVYTGNREIRFTSITHGSFILDFRDYPGSLVDSISSSFQKSLEDLLHYKSLSGTHIWMSPGEAHLVQYLADPPVIVL